MKLAPREGMPEGKIAVHTLGERSARHGVARTRPAVPLLDLNSEREPLGARAQAHSPPAAGAKLLHHVLEALASAF